MPFASLVSGRVLRMWRCGLPEDGLSAGSGLDASGSTCPGDGRGRQAEKYPDLRFSVGSMLDLDLPDGQLGGVLSSYSITICLRPRYRSRSASFSACWRLVGTCWSRFHVGDIVRHLTHGVRPLDLAGTSTALQPDRVAAQLVEAGFTMVPRLVRAHGTARQSPSRRS